MTVSYKDERGRWLAGQPPREVALASYAGPLVEADDDGETLAEAQERRRAHRAEQESAWLTEAQVCEALSLDVGELYSVQGLLTECQVRGGELMFSAAAVAAHAEARDSAEAISAEQKADALTDELRRQGLDLPGLGGAA